MTKGINLGVAVALMGAGVLGLAGSAAAAVVAGPTLNPNTGSVLSDQRQFLGHLRECGRNPLRPSGHHQQRLRKQLTSSVMPSPSTSH